jgi:peptide chain release factor subunit 1
MVFNESPRIQVDKVLAERSSPTFLLSQPISFLIIRCPKQYYNAMSDMTEIEQWKLRKTIQRLETTEGSGTSMITLVIPPKDPISKSVKLLTDEYGAASNIKSRVNRASVQTAIRSVQAKLKLVSRVPPNGIAIFCGEALTEDGRTRKITEAIEPPKPINFSFYRCGNRFEVK